jgi:hypothetical protein
MPRSRASISKNPADALKRPIFKAVAKGKVRSNVSGWVLHQGGDPAKRILSDKVFILSKLRLISLRVNGIHHNIDVLRLSPQGVKAVKLLQKEIRGLVIPSHVGSEQGSINSLRTYHKLLPAEKPCATGATPSTSKQSTSQEDSLVPSGIKDLFLKPNDSAVWVACPNCSFEVITEKIKPDKYSGRNSAQNYLNFIIKGSKRTVEKLFQARSDLEEKFIKQDEAAILRYLAMEKAAKAKLSRTEAWAKKSRTAHYQDLIDFDSEEQIGSQRGSSRL